MPVVSKKQAHLFGLIASGKKPTKTKVKGLSKEEAKEALKGQKIKGLPLKKKKKKKKK